MKNDGQQLEMKKHILDDIFEQEIYRRNFLQKTAKFGVGAVGLTLLNSLGVISAKAEYSAPVTLSSNPASSKLYTIDFKSTDELARYTRLSSLKATQPLLMAHRAGYSPQGIWPENAL